MFKTRYSCTNSLQLRNSDILYLEKDVHTIFEYPECCPGGLCYPRIMGGGERSDEHHRFSE